MLAVNIFGAHESGVRFTSFTLAFLTLLGIATGEDWTEHVINLTSESGQIDTGVLVFFVSFIGLVAIVAVVSQCVCECVCACVCARVRACVCVCVRERVCVSTERVYCVRLLLPYYSTYYRMCSLTTHVSRT